MTTTTKNMTTATKSSKNYWYKSRKDKTLAKKKHKIAARTNKDYDQTMQELELHSTSETTRVNQ